MKIHHIVIISGAMVSGLLLTACGPVPVPAPPGDTTAPTLAEVTPVPNSPYKDATPSYTFSSTEAGTITWGGGCSSATLSATSGNNTVTLSSLAVGYYNNCTVKVTDAGGNASAELAITPFIVGKPYNDTGITKCGDYAYPDATNNNDVDCINGTSPSATASEQNAFEISVANGADPVPGGQDALFGHDANPATNSDADGHKGFSFTKLSAVDGTILATQNGSWSDAGSETAGTQWGCVQDNVTGLVWEVKTNDGGLRDKDWIYTWYKTGGVNDGGDHGIGDTGVGTTTGYETFSGTYAGSDNCYNTSRCDTEKYVADLNAGSGLCGNTDWRLPTKAELLTIVAKDRKNPAIDSGLMPNTVSNSYWSASPFAINRSDAWVVTFSPGFDNYDYGKGNSYYVRLVRGDY